MSEEMVHIELRITPQEGRFFAAPAGVHFKVDALTEDLVALGVAPTINDILRGVSRIMTMPLIIETGPPSTEVSDSCFGNPVGTNKHKTNKRE